MSAAFLTSLSVDIHQHNVKAGWWKEHVDYGGVVPDVYFVSTKIALMHSELSEGLEGLRKNLPDDKLPQYPMEAVEYADAIIRILDVCGKRGYPIGEIVDAKRAFNAVRPDHKQEAREADGGKRV